MSADHRTFLKTHNNAGIFFVLHKAIVKPHKLFVLSNTGKLGLLERLEGSLKGREATE